MTRSFVIGDIHGAYLALKECLRLSEFDYEHDRLICLGDVCDGWPEVRESIDELLRIRNLIYIVGNHDDWALKWFNSGIAQNIWKTQGGSSTMTSYSSGVPESHINLLQNAYEYYIENERLYVHGGFKPGIPLEMQGRETFLWTRSLVNEAYRLTAKGQEYEIGSFREIFIGHTPTQNFNSIVPLKFCNVWLMDTGAGWHGGYLAMKELDSDKLFMSRQVNLLYPDFKGRNKEF